MRDFYLTSKPDPEIAKPKLVKQIAYTDKSDYRSPDPKTKSPDLKKRFRPPDEILLSNREKVYQNSDKRYC